MLALRCRSGEAAALQTSFLRLVALMGVIRLLKRSFFAPFVATNRHLIPSFVTRLYNVLFLLLQRRRQSLASRQRRRVPL